MIDGVKHWIRMAMRGQQIPAERNMRLIGRRRAVNIRNRISEYKTGNPRMRYQR